MTTFPLLLDIKGNSLDDGPGIRSVVFLKGCPLDCTWCHNPESKHPGPELSFDGSDCIGCDTCIPSCSIAAINRKNPFFIDRNRCNLCYTCVDTCPSGALARVGTVTSPEAILARVLRDKPFYDTSGGGVTLSGGEPTLNMAFCSDLLRCLKENGIHTLVETCGQFDIQRFRRLILPYTDMIYCDVKFIDPDRHKHHCGIGNGTILNTIRELVTLSRNGGPELLLRVPLVPGITATQENLKEIAAFLNDLGISKAALMEYNPLWQNKPATIGQSAPIATGNPLGTWMTKDAVNDCREIFHQAGIETV